MRGALACVAALQRLSTLLTPHIKASDTRFLSFKSISSPGIDRVDIPHLKSDSIELYKSTTIRYVRHPSISEMCNYVMTKKVFKFRMGKKEFLIYPLDKVVQKKNNEQKILGYFDRITTVNNSVLIRYKNGDKSILGPSYSSTVQIQSSQQESYDARFKENPSDMLISLNVNEPLIYDQETVLGVYRKNSSFDPIIQTVLEEQSRESKQKRLPPSILQQLGFGMPAPSGAAKPAMPLATNNSAKNHNEMLDKASLKRIVKKFKKDLDMAQRASTPAAEDLINKNLQTSFKDFSQIKKPLKRARDEKYETRIASREFELDGQGEVEGIERLSKMFAKYFHSAPSFQSNHISDIQNSILDQNISKRSGPGELLDTNEEKEGEENTEEPRKKEPAREL